MEVTGARGARPKGHGLKIRGHRELAGVKGNSPRPIRRPEGRAKAADAMAGGRSSRTLTKRAQTAMKYKIESTGGRRGARRSSPRGKARTGEARGRRSVWRSRARRFRRCCGLRARRARRKRAGQQGGGRAGAGSDLKRPGTWRGTPTMHDVGAGGGYG